MPLTNYQIEIVKLLAQNRTEDSHLAGGAALHHRADSIRFSEDLDYFHDTEIRVTTAYIADKKILEENNYKVSVEIAQPGYVRCVVNKNSDATKIEWARDTAWRFMPVIKNPEFGFMLHPIDLAINKLLALVGRDEPRDFLDVLHIHKTILPLGALIWAACGKDPGFTPHSILDLLKRRGRYQHEDFERLHLKEPISLQTLKSDWLSTLQTAEHFIQIAPAKTLGNLFFSTSTNRFVEPKDFSSHDIKIHQGKSGGVLPILKD